MSWPGIPFATVEQELAFLRAHAQVARLTDALLEDCLERGLGLEAALDVYLCQCGRLLGAREGFVQVWGTRAPVCTVRMGVQTSDDPRIDRPQGLYRLPEGTLLVKRLTLGSLELGTFGLVVPDLTEADAPAALALVDAMGEQLDSSLLGFAALADGSAPAQKLDELAPAGRPRSRFGRYELLLPLGTGGMAQVFVARLAGPEGIGRLVALKRILPQLAGDDETVREFLDEAEVGLKLAHPNLVTVYDFGRAPAGYYLAMQLVRGAGLRTLLTKHGPLPAPVAVGLLVQALRGLQAAHSLFGDDGKPLQLVHRDLSPQNVMLGFDGVVKVLDFGIAKLRTQRTKTSIGLLKGKPVYMSPEQALGDPVDHRSDLFSATLVLYELLTGVRAFQRDAEVATLTAIVSEPARRHELIPAPLWPIIEKGLAKGRADRFAHALEMADRLATVVPPAGERELADFARKHCPATWEASQRWDATAKRACEIP